MTPEQFSQIVLKDDLEQFRKEVATKEDIAEIKEILEVLVKNTTHQEEENISNTVAHDRFNKNFKKIKDHLNLDSLEAVESI